MFTASIFFLTCLFVSTRGEEKCGISNEPALGVISGQELPWIAEIISGRGVISGMGVLIDQRHVITAQYVADTFTHIKPEFVELAAGKSQEGQRYKVEEIKYVTIKNHSENLGKPGIAILRLSEPATNVTPICLPKVGETFSVDSYHYVSYNIGTDSIHPDKYGLKYHSELKAVGFDECKESYKDYKNLVVFDRAVHMCAGDSKEDSCIGEAGSPLMVKEPSGVWKVVALSFFGPAKCATGIPSVFTNVINQSDRIRQALSS